MELMTEQHELSVIQEVETPANISQVADSALREISPLSSDSGRGADYSGPAITSYRSYTETVKAHMWRKPGVHFHSSLRFKTRREVGSMKALQVTTLFPHRPVTRSEGDNTVDPVYEHFSGGHLSQAEDPEQDSFRPLIGHLADQSSCLAADQRGLAMEHLVGQPSAHSSMIGHIPGLPVAVSLDQGGWDSTLSRMIGQLSHQSSFNWLSGGQDFYADQLMGQLVQEPSTTWLDEGQEESLMRPLVGELDNDQHSGSSGERTCVDLGVSTEARVPLYTALPPEASSHSSNIPSVSQHPEHQELPSRSHQMDSGPERSEGSDSFHPLLAEITHNETVDPSMTFHLLEHNVPTSPEGQPATGRRNVPTPHEESETHSDPSPERLRTQHAVHESCQGQPQESVLTLDDTVRTDVELTAPNLSHFSMCDESDALDLPQPADISAGANSISEILQLPGPFSDLCAEELMSEQGSHVRDELPVSDKTLEGLSEKGILEQSDITLVSLTDTTVQDQETTITEEDPVQEDKLPTGRGGKDGQAKRQR
ncbi:hypothetical protein INR49_003640 [Caranx melampygus]|nr:hypothetical protein INR49_003640 [Caranx melampygus]